MSSCWDMERAYTHTDTYRNADRKREKERKTKQNVRKINAVLYVPEVVTKSKNRCQQWLLSSRWTLGKWNSSGGMAQRGSQTITITSSRIRPPSSSDLPSENKTTVETWGHSSWLKSSLRTTTVLQQVAIPYSIAWNWFTCPLYGQITTRRYMRPQYPHTV